jgi:hypothetical protein
MVNPMAHWETPNSRAYNGTTGTMLPKPSWVRKITPHNQTRTRFSRYTSAGLLLFFNRFLHLSV